ncbi:hypothetical protein [Agromyces bracchium]|uniref:Uncharacterized protein n=1 Tax=Agromyces bracchium TaxID=88376 RepID=A0A6I3M6Z4_9MICO|nr:hypothetical protein [Agromyces bracchium]MTH67942.1 hypothetical protein [Agromyces bracchium]
MLLQRSGDALNDLNTEPNGDARGMSRRSLAKAAAWSVPAVLVAAPAPAYAASAGTSSASVVGSCAGSGATGTISVTLPNLPVGSVVQIVLSHSGQGGFTATPNFTPTSQSGTTYTITGTGTTFVGEFSINFNLGNNQHGTVTATVTAVSGVAIEGDTAGFVTKRRDGGSQNYNQCSAG